ncbi:hypothetical protein NPIL_484971 [Nephila pilipes]|uniref:BHLH domain-containing protein n=1 Tax=Nephila pilipes TaxID=299642 RepID=A0A8X6PPX2_NEPPI|nr:hypothetical protein NPIL_484971 [Nephila pilipes]
MSKKERNKIALTSIGTGRLTIVFEVNLHVSFLLYFGKDATFLQSRRIENSQSSENLQEIKILMGRRKIQSVPHHVKERLRHQKLQEILENVANHVPKHLAFMRETKTKMLRRVVLYVKYLLLKKEELSLNSDGIKKVSKERHAVIEKKTALRKASLEYKSEDRKANIVFLTKSSEKKIPCKEFKNSIDVENAESLFNKKNTNLIQTGSCSTVSASACLPEKYLKTEWKKNEQLVEHLEKIVKDDKINEKQTSSLNENEFLFKDNYFTDLRKNQSSFKEYTKHFATDSEENQIDYVSQNFSLPGLFKKESTLSPCVKNTVKSFGAICDQKYQKPVHPELYTDEESFYSLNKSPSKVSEPLELQREKTSSTNQISFSQKSDNFSSEFFSSGESGPLPSSYEHILSDDDYNYFPEIPYQNPGHTSFPSRSFVPEHFRDEDIFENSYSSLQRSCDISTSPDIFSIKNHPVPSTSLEFPFNNHHNYGTENNLNNAEILDATKHESAAIYPDYLGDRFMNVHQGLNLYPSNLIPYFPGAYSQAVNSGNFIMPSNTTHGEENFIRGFHLPYENNFTHSIQITPEPFLPTQEQSCSFNNFNFSNNWFMDNFNSH